MSTSLFDAIREATARVCAMSRHVAIDQEAIEGFAAGLDVAAARAPGHAPDSHHLGRGDETVQFFVTLDAINFGSGYFPHLTKLPGKSGYFTVAAHLARRYREHGPLPAEALRAMTPEAAAALFGQRPDNGDAMELMGLFARALADLGELLLRDFDGSAAALVAAADNKAETLCGLLQRMPLFRDVQPYRGFEAPFFKRAQLMSADLSVAFGNQGPGRFDDLGRLTVFADNLVPHVLRLDGILRLDEDLRERIEAGTPLKKDSEEEVELRAATVQAVERLSLALGERGCAVSPLELDFLLWNRGQQPAYKAVPRPRCRTWFY